MGLPGITKNHMVKIDRIMTKKYKIPIESMMEHAGLNLARLAIKFSTQEIKEFIIIAGSGNNTGGGLVAARRLASWGFDVKIYLAKGKDKLNLIARHQLQRTKQLCLQYFEGLPEDKSSTNDKSRVYLDAYLGYGFTFRPDKITEEVFSFLSGCTNLISLDTPSGLDVTTGQFYSDLKPIATLSLAFVKIGLMIVEPKSIGELFIADIGVPIHIYEKELNIQWKSPYDIKSLKKLNEKFSQDSIQKVRINRHEDIMKSYWDII